MIDFTGHIHKIGINPVIDPPDDVLEYLFHQAERSKGPIAVRGSIEGVPFLQTLVKYAGLWRLYINGPMLRSAGVSVGTMARIKIEVDPTPRTVPMPEALRHALEKDPAKKLSFAALTRSRQEEIKRYLASLRSDAALRRSIDKVLHQLADRPA